MELDGKTVGIIGYGHMGKAFAKKLKGFDVEVLCYDIKPNVGDDNATQVALKEFQNRVEVVSLHTPQTPRTIGMINSEFIQQFAHPFWLINTARGLSVVTKDLVAALESGQILGAGLDVLEYEKSSFENLFSEAKMPKSLQDLMQFKQVLFSPHVAGWTVESHRKLAQTIVDKVKRQYH
jgi:D-3-phosphoglycerate dehydrogenase